MRRRRGSNGKRRRAGRASASASASTPRRRAKRVERRLHRVAVCDPAPALLGVSWAIRPFEQRTAVRASSASAARTAGSAWIVAGRLVALPVDASPYPTGVQTSTTAISLRVSVPVLSVQMKVVEPSVSTDSRRRTRAFRRAIRCAPTASESVTVGSSPSGTRATVTPMAKRNPSPAGRPSASAMAKNTTPTPTAMSATTRTTDLQLARERARRSLARPGEMCDAGQARIAPDRRDDRPGLTLDDERSCQELLADVHGRPGRSRQSRSRCRR